MSNGRDIVERLHGYAEIPDMDWTCQSDIAAAKAEIIRLRNALLDATEKRKFVAYAVMSVDDDMIMATWCTKKDATEDAKYRPGTYRVARLVEETA